MVTGLHSHTMPHTMDPRLVIRASLVIFIAIPFLTFVLAILFGSILGAFEKWHWREGPLYVLGNLIGLATPFTNVTPDSTGGQMIDVFLSIQGISLAAVVTGMAANFHFVETLTRKLEGAQDDPSKMLHKISETTEKLSQQIAPITRDELADILARQQAEMKQSLEETIGRLLSDMGPRAVHVHRPAHATCAHIGALARLLMRVRSNVHAPL